jgi:hypothetical protein
LKPAVVFPSVSKARNTFLLVDFLPQDTSTYSSS